MATALHIPGVGQLCIQPGGADLAECARQLERVTDDIHAYVMQLGVTSLAEAEQRAEQQRHLKQQLQQQEAVLARYAPQGVEALVREQHALQQRQEGLAAQLAELPPLEGDVLSVALAETALDAAEAQLRHAEQALTAQQMALALCEQRVQRAQHDVEQLRATVQSAEYQQRIHELSEELMTHRNTESTLMGRLDMYRQCIEAVNPTILRQDIERFSASAEVSERAAQQRQITLAALQGRLVHWGEQDIEAEHAKLTVTIKGLEQRQAELQRRVDALTMLHERLSQKRQAFMQQVRAPLKKRLTHYLRLLFPHSDVQLNDELAPESLQRAPHENTQVEELSFGTREQMGLLSRLAYADVLQEAGKPTLIILDDVLTNSDTERLEQMKRVLFDAAQRHQILLFSCHPEQWRDVGVVARELSAIKAGL